MFAGWLAQTAHAYPTWPIAVQQAEGPVLRIRKSRAPPTMLDDMGPFGHTREIERPAPPPRSLGDSTSVTAGRPLVMCGPLRLSGFELRPSGFAMSIPAYSVVLFYTSFLVPHGCILSCSGEGCGVRG
jgi:hypothetical protein